MRITINNRKEVFNEDKLTLDKVLEKMNFTYQRKVVKLNGKLVKKPGFAKTEVVDGDEINVIFVIGGG
jgi:thiamine biosynthesis protein ThiS